MLRTSAPRSWRLAQIDRPVKSPTAAREPGARQGHRRSPHWPRNRRPPPVEPRRRRSGVEPARAGNMFPPIVEDIDEGVPNFARGRKGARVVAVTPDRSVPPEGPIHRLRDANGEALEATRERRLRVRLQQQVQMIRLRRGVQDAEAPIGRCGQCVTNRCEEPLAAQRRHALTQPQRRVDGAAGVMRYSSPVRHARSATRRRLPSGPGAPAAPRPDGELELSCTRRHLIGHIYQSRVRVKHSSRRGSVPLWSALHDR